MVLKLYHSPWPCGDLRFLEVLDTSSLPTNVVDKLKLAIKAQSSEHEENKKRKFDGHVELDDKMNSNQNATKLQPCALSDVEKSAQAILSKAIGATVCTSFQVSFVYNFLITLYYFHQIVLRRRKSCAQTR